MALASPLSALLLEAAANNRHGLTFAPQVASLSKSDVSEFTHVGVATQRGNGWQSASGGVSPDPNTAVLAAIGEGVERYTAAQAIVPLKLKRELSNKQLIDAKDFTLFSEHQRQSATFPFDSVYSQDCPYTEVFTLDTNEPFWVPQPLVVLRDDYATGIPTSSGLAAGKTPTDALLRGLQELLERDALMATWLHSIPGRRVATPAWCVKQISKLHGTIFIFDITPQYSPFPVIAVAGGIPKRGQLRFSLGVACRESLDLAIEKAYAEWCQGIFFTGMYAKMADTSHLKTPNDAKNFDDHAIYYTLFPDTWDSLPLFKDIHTLQKPTTQGTKRRGKAALLWGIQRLTRRGVRLLYRDLTTIDALQAGVHVVRVLSPDFIPINAHHEWPFLGGTAANVQWRYPHATPGLFPNPWPHPLG